jgi:hypothetical protein
MQYYCTICSKKKVNEQKLLPAIERYASQRIQNVYVQAKKANKRMIILSGRYGFLQPYDLIPYYDHLLLERNILELLPILLNQNKSLRITKLDCFMKDRNIFGWEAYYKILEKFSTIENVNITIYNLK